MKKDGLLKKGRAFEKKKKKKRGLQINADTETRSGYIFYRSMRIRRHVRVIYSTDQCGYRDTFGIIYSTDQCGYRDTFGLYITRCSLLRHTQ